MNHTPVGIKEEIVKYQILVNQFFLVDESKLWETNSELVCVNFLKVTEQFLLKTFYTALGVCLLGYSKSIIAFTMIFWDKQIFL